MIAPAQLIVCETSSKWVVGMRRQLDRQVWSRICETRNLDDCWQQAVASCKSAVALEMTFANLEPLAEFLLRLRTQLPHTLPLVLGSRSLARAEWPMREFGAVHVALSLRELPVVAEMVQRHWQRVAREEPAGELPPWHALPWGQAGESFAGYHEPQWLRRLK